MRTTVAATGPAPVSLAWRRYAELDQWPVWAPQITGVDAPSRLLVPGLRGEVRGLGVLRVAFEVLDVDEQDRTWSWQAALGPARLRLEHGVEEAIHRGAPGSRTWLHIDGPAPVVLPYTPVAFVALHSLVHP